MSLRLLTSAVLAFSLSGFSSHSLAAVEPMLNTLWGQDGIWQAHTPVKDGSGTYPGCTTIATAQLLYYYQYQATAKQDVSYTLIHDGLSHQDISNGQLSLALSSFEHDWSSMAKSKRDSTEKKRQTAKFIYHVAVSLNAQFGGGEGSTATGKQIENAFRYQWGFNNKARREMSIITKAAFGFSDEEWAELIRNELDAGRPVLYMAQQVDADAGHAFIIDGYRDDGKVHVNWGWSGRANGYFDPNTLTDPYGRSWSRDAMIFRGLEPEEGYAAAMKPNLPESTSYAWHGNGSIISYNSDNLEGYGLTQDEAFVNANNDNGVVLFQWQVDKRDGERLLIDAENASSANITYGVWNDRSKDRLYKKVKLPFTLDPSADGYSNIDQEYFVIAVSFDKDQKSTGIVSATVTQETGSNQAASIPAELIEIDKHQWQGNGSLISFGTGSKTGYGITQDEIALAATDKPSVGFFQWEIDSRDGEKLLIEANGQKARITYGYWNDRSSDKTHEAELPFTIDPKADGFELKDQDYLTIKVELLEAIESASILEAKITK